jgi:hypothetical protein
MKPSKKFCDGCKLEQFIWKNEKGNRYCKNCWSRLQTVTGKHIKPTKSSKPIAPRSKKRATQEREYSKVRKDFLLSSPTCQAKLPNQCTIHTTDVHHMKGRIGELLTNPQYFLAVCRACHTWIELHPKEAKELGFSISKN